MHLYDYDVDIFPDVSSQRGVAILIIFPVCKEVLRPSDYHPGSARARRHQILPDANGRGIPALERHQSTVSHLGRSSAIPASIKIQLPDGRTT